MTCLALFDGVAPEADALLRVQQAGLPVEAWNTAHAAQRLVHSHGAQRLPAMPFLQRLELVLWSQHAPRWCVPTKVS